MSQDTESCIIVVGSRFTVEFAVLDDRSMPAKPYYDSLSKADRAGLFGYMQHLACIGEINNQPKKFQHERGPFWAFKRKGQNARMIRLPCYQEGLRWIITHGFDKPRQRFWDESEFT